MIEEVCMLTVRATLQPDGQIELPSALLSDKPQPVLVTFLESQREPDAGSTAGSVASTLALLQSAEFRELPRADAEEVERRIHELRGDWDDA